jgi:hypothetical protein
VSLRVFIFAVFCCVSCFAQSVTLLVSVADENGVPLKDVAIELHGKAVAHCVTDATGRCRLSAMPDAQELVASKAGFYRLVARDVRGRAHVEIALTHTQELKESVEVTATPPGLDPEQVASVRSVDNTEIINIPFPVTRDIRNVLPYIPGVIQDRIGQIHVAGAETYQTLTLLDGFMISDPQTGFLNSRFSTDAVRAIDIQQSRYSSQFGPASGGVTAFTSISGDDKFRFSATNFVPSLKFQDGVHLDKVTPRVTLSGPLVKGRAWFLLAPEGEYDSNFVQELPPGRNNNPVWRGSNLAKLQLKLTPANIVTASLLGNIWHSTYGGISPQTPIETTLDESRSSYVATVRDQTYIGGAMFDLGVALSRFHDRALPLGTLPYVIGPGFATGNFYRSQRSSAGRLELQANAYLRRFHFAGSHELRLGGVMRNIDDTETIARTPISILRRDNTLYSVISFTNPPPMSTRDTQVGAFMEDHWAPAERLFFEFGTRTDHDSAIHALVFSPHIAATYMLTAATKLSAGIGLHHDFPTPAILSRMLQGARSEDIYDATGTVITGPTVTTSFAAPGVLRSPTSRNWSIAVEHQLRAGLFVSAEYIDRHTLHDFAYDFRQVTLTDVELRLGNNRTTQYRALQTMVHASFKHGYELLIAYTRSTARASAVLDYTLDNPVLNPQAGGPLPWDAPNKIVSWGFLPMPHFHKWSFGYSAQWHTGLPYSIFNQFQNLIGTPNIRRFPQFVMINPFLERRITVKNYNLALRGGFEDITGSKNPQVVQNNVDAPDFGQYTVTAHRAFVARIRFLGKR